jgi:hypothetical protein
VFIIIQFVYYIFDLVLYCMSYSDVDKMFLCHFLYDMITEAYLEDGTDYVDLGFIALPST